MQHWEQRCLSGTVICQRQTASPLRCSDDCADRRRRLNKSQHWTADVEGGLHLALAASPLTLGPFFEDRGFFWGSDAVRASPDGVCVCSCSLDVMLVPLPERAMCRPALPLWLLLWVAGSAVSRTQGEVRAPPSLSAETGQPLLLSCNITMAPGSTVQQVRWLNRHSELLLAYEQRGPVRVSHQDPSVQLAASHKDGSHIAIKALRPEDEGCYRCVFDVYPTGLQEGKTCVSVTGKVRLEGNKTAVSGQPATLSCSYSLPERVHQVLWRKTAEQGDTTTVASYAKRGRQSVAEPFAGRASLSRGLGDTQLSIQPVRTEDEACYTCEFHAYPDGTKSATACLSVYVLPKPEVSHVTSPSGVTEANCTAQSRPAAEITWNIGGDNRTLGPPISSAYDQGDGTTVVTSTLLFPSGLLADVSVKCTVHHPGLKKPLTASLNAEVGPAMVILLSVCGVLAVLLLCLCVCLCKCFICTDD